MAWKPEVYVDKQWSRNALVFATEEEAKENAAALYRRWTLCGDYRAVEVDEPVNYSFVNGQLVPVNTSTA